MSLWPVIGSIAPLMVSTVGFGSIGVDYAASAAAVGSITTTANRALIEPIYVPSDMLVRKFAYITSTAPSGNIDMGLYDDAYNRIVSSGSVAIGGASALVEVDVTDTPIDRGMYYLAIATSSAAANLSGYSPGALLSLLKAAGGLQQDTAFALPATLTPVVVTAAPVPLMGISQRVLVA